MVMLATGMRESFRRFLLVQGFDLRIAPKGTLPMDTEATIGSASEILAALRANPQIASVTPVLGAQIHLLGSRAGDDDLRCRGSIPRRRRTISSSSGDPVADPDRIVVNAGISHPGARAR